MTNKNMRVRDFMLRAMLGLSNDEPELLAIFSDKLYGLMNIVKQRDEELYNEIIRFYTGTTSSEKIKVELNRNRRSLNNEG